MVWSRELAAEVPRDLIRFHLAATSPEHQRTSFGREALVRVTSSRLVEPWNVVADKVNRWVGRGPLPVSSRSRRGAARMAERFAASYELAGFSLNRAAETIADQLARLASREVTAASAGDFCFEVDRLLRGAAPILIDLAAEVLGEDGGAEARSFTPVALPRLASAEVRS